MKTLALGMLFASVALGQSMPTNMSGMQMPSSSNPAAQQASAESDPLAETAGRAPLRLDDLLASARVHNPTLRAAQAVIAESAGRAKQAGVLPNPVIGYEGDQIRGGSYGGGEQGGFVEQTIPLGGKLGLRRDVYRASSSAPIRSRFPRSSSPSKPTLRAASTPRSGCSRRSPRASS